jgi:tripartite-type tricarboxylate transporter receptor subunit TctC
MKCKHIKTVLVVVALVFFSASATLADDYPSKPVNLYIGYSGGGSTDISARLLANLAQKDFSQPIVCINKPGGVSSVMHGLVAHSKPDGYTLGVLMTAAITRIPHLRTVPYNPLSDFVPIMQYAVYQYGICVRSDSPFKKLSDFIEYAKENPGKVTYSTAGSGSGQHLAMEYLALKEGIKWTHIPYKGGVPAVTACLGGHVTATAQTIEWKPYVEAGQLRLLAVMGEKRIESFPDVPTMLELGYDFTVGAGLGIVGPKGLPDSVVKKIADAFTAASKEEGFKALLNKLDLLPLAKNRQELESEMAKEYQQTGELVKGLGMGIYSK